MLNGVGMEREEGTPQGGPLSPLLANILLDELDKERGRVSRHEPGLPQRETSTKGFPQPAREVQDAHGWVNRPVRTRTPGGVGGGEGNNPAFPIRAD
jgi:retron-type reverse transcriptase